MTETEQLIHQAARELQINRDGNNPVEAMQDGSTYAVTFRSRQGEHKEVEITDGASFTLIHQTLKAAWRGNNRANQ